MLTKRDVLLIWDQQGRLLVWVRHGHNRLYLLHLQVARPMSLGMRDTGISILCIEEDGTPHYDTWAAMAGSRRAACHHQALS